MHQLKQIPIKGIKSDPTIRSNTLEAMAMGKAVVSTTKVADGVGATAGKHCLIADEAADCLRFIESLLSEKERCRQLSTAGPDFIWEYFNWETNMAVFDQLLGEG